MIENIGRWWVKVSYWEFKGYELKSCPQHARPRFGTQTCYKAPTDTWVSLEMMKIINTGWVRLLTKQWLKVGNVAAKKADKKVVLREKNSYAEGHIKTENLSKILDWIPLEALNVRILIPAIHGAFDLKTNSVKHKFFSQKLLRKGW